MSEEVKRTKLTAPCPHCGTLRDPTLRCPKCGHQPDVLGDELARVNKAISDMKQRDIQLMAEVKKNAQTMQAALHQRNLLISTEAERQKKGAPKQRPWSRRTPTAPPSPPVPPPPIPPKQRRPRQTIQVEPHLEPEASPRLVQNVLLALAPLMLGITAVIFALIDLRDNVNPGTRLTVLGLVTVLLLVAPPILVQRGLFSTAESLATVGLGLLPVDGYVIAQLDTFQGGGGQTTVYGVIFAVTTAIAFVYHHYTGLTSARYMFVLASQPVLFLLAYEHVKGPAGWALVFALIAAQNALITRGLELYHRPTPTPTIRTTHWLWELTWILHGLAIGTALVYAIAALLTGHDLAATTRAAFTLLLVAAVGVLGSFMLRTRPLGDLASGLLTLAVIASAARVALIAIPQNAILVIAFVVFATSLAVRALPAEARRGPQLASTVALGVVSLFVVGEALRAAVAPLRASLPMWTANVEGYQALVAQHSTGASWRLVITIALITAAAFLALPPAFRRESAVAGAALTVLAMPASFHLGWVASLWLLTLSAVAFLFFWTPITARAATAQAIAFVVVALGAIGVGLARQWSTAGVLAAITVAGAAVVLLHRARPVPPEAIRITDTAAGAAAFAAPGAMATGLLTLMPTVSTSVALTVGYLTASATLALVAVRLVAHRRIGVPLAIGTGLGALVITGAAFGMDGAEGIDAGVGALLLAAAILLALAPSIDEGMRADRVLDGADVAAAAVTVAVVASLARTAELLAPSQWLFQSAVAVLIVAIGVRALPAHWRRGPSVGAGIAGAIIGAIAGYYALAGGLRAVTTPGELFEARVPDVAPPTHYGWQVPAALIVLAVAAAVALPRPRNYDAAAAAIVLATLGAPAELGWPWWSPIVLGLAIATVYSIASTVAIDARAGYARLTVAIIVGLHALLASLVLLWTFAAALAVIALLTAVVAGVSSVVTRMSIADGVPPPSHLEVVGGTGLLGALLAGPAAVAAYAAHSEVDADAVLTVTVLTIFGTLGLLLLVSRYISAYLGWGTVGIALSSTAVAVAALILGRPAGVYAAAAVLFVVLAELLRANAAPPPVQQIQREERLPGGARRWRVGSELWSRRRWPVRPGSMAAAGAAAPAIIAVASLAPALRASLVTPHETMNRIWQGPPPPLPFPVDNTAVVTAILLTIAAAVAAIGFGGGMTRAVSVVVPGVALTILIMPVSLGMPWPASVMAGLVTFTLCMLSVALTFPPEQDESTSGTRAARIAVLLIGLVAGSAGLAGSLATPEMTIFTFAGAVGVGLIAALWGKVERARILGWLGGALAAQLLVLSVSLRVGAKPEWAAFAVLAVGAALIACASLLPRFTRPEALGEASAIEWAGYAAGVIAIMLALRSTAHVAALLVGWGAVLAMAATRAGRPEQQRRILFWIAAASEVVAWVLIMRSADVALPEAYTIPFALLALAVGLIEIRQRPHLGSWTAYGPALVIAFGPTVVVVLAVETHPARVVGLLLGGIAVLIWGSQTQQRAPVAIGAAVTTIVAFHALTLVGTTWLAVGIAGIVLLIIGASSERRRRATERYNKFR